MKLANLNKLRRDVRWHVHALFAWTLRSKYKLVLAVTVAVAFAEFTPMLGFIDTLVGVYAIFVLILRIPSNISFAAAIALLVDIPLAQATHHEILAEQLAVYVFYILCIGTIAALFENLRQPVHRASPVPIYRHSLAEAAIVHAPTPKPEPTRPSGALAPAVPKWRTTATPLESRSIAARERKKLSPGYAMDIVRRG